MRKDEIVALNNRSLKSIVATINPNGIYGQQRKWAMDELTRRGVDYSDCLLPVENNIPY